MIFLTRRIAEDLEQGLISWVQVPLAILDARAVLGGLDPKKLPDLFGYEAPTTKAQDDAMMLAVWMALTVREDEERTERIEAALKTLRDAAYTS